jgi:hypothetical protein
VAEEVTGATSERAFGASAGFTVLVRKWGYRGALCSSFVCLAAAAYYYAEFLAAPPSYHIYGIYYGLRESGNLFAEYTTFSLLVAGWMRRFSRRLVLATGIAVTLLVLNVAFAWTSGVLGYVLTLIPNWLPQGVIIEYLSLIQFPAVRSALDFYYLGWLGALFALSMAFFKSGTGRRLVHSLEFAVVALLPLPLEVYLFDRREFSLHVMDAQIGTSLQWFSNADLLAALVVALSVLAAADGLVLETRSKFASDSEEDLSGPGGI